MAGCWPLKPRVMVRIHVPQPDRFKFRLLFWKHFNINEKWISSGSTKLKES